LLYVLVLIISLVCPGFTQAIVQFDKSIFILGVNPLSGDPRKLWKQGGKRVAVWCCLKRCFGIWNCCDNFKIMDDWWCILTSDAILNDVLKVWATKKILKTRTRNSVFWRSLKRCIVSWKCWENVKSKGEQMVNSDSIWNVVWKLELIRKSNKQGS